eukprot:6473004-Pyramimonas_sp.AAC.1
MDALRHTRAPVPIERPRNLIFRGAPLPLMLHCRAFKPSDDIVRGAPRLRGFRGARGSCAE